MVQSVAILALKFWRRTFGKIFGAAMHVPLQNWLPLNLN